MRLLPAILFLVSSFCAALPIQSHASDSMRYAIRHYTDDDGLPQNSILSLYSGKAGFLWMTTEDGLVRFDGQHFFIFNKQETGLASNRFSKISSSIFDDKKYALGTGDNCLLIEDARTIKAAQFKAETDRVLAEQGCRLNRSAGDVIIPIGRNTFYILKGDSIFFYKDGLRRKIRFGHPRYLNRNFFLVGDQLYHLFSDNVVFACDVDGGRPISINGFSNDKVASGRNCMALLNIKDTPPFAIVNDQLYRIDIVNGVFVASKLLEKIPVMLHDVRCVYQDAATGSVFLGTASNGLYFYQRQYFQTHSQNNLLFYAQAAISDSTILLPQGIVLGSARQSQPIPRHNVEEGVYSMFTDHKGYVWMYEDALLKIDPMNLQVVERRESREHLFIITGGLNNKIWAGSRAGNLYQSAVDRTNDSLSFVVNIPRASCLFQENEHKLWVGAYDALYCYHPDTKTIDTVKEFAGKYVRSFYQDKDDYLWITTYEDGVFLLKNKRVVHFPYDPNNYLAAAHCILEDKKGFFWITTNKGLFQVPRKELLDYANGSRSDLFYLYYGKENGFSTNEFNGGCLPCGLKLGNGCFSFPSLNGMVWFKPDSLKLNLPDKDIFIDKMVLDGVDIPVESQMQFDKHFDLLTIRVTTPYLGDHRNIHLYYRLIKDGEEPYWPVPENGIISLPGLASGSHELEISKITGFGKADRVVRKINLSISAYWYETWWFFTLAVIAVIGLVFVATHLRIRILKRRNQWLELQVQRRTQKLEHTLDTLKASQTAKARQAYIQQRLIAAISHDVRTPLRFLTAANKRIYERLLNMTTDGDLLEMSRDAGDTSGRMQDYLGNLLQYIKTTSYQQKAELQRVPVEPLVQQQADMFRQLMKDNGTLLVISASPDLEAHTNAQLLAIILHNIIDNAAKNTFDGTIRINCNSNADKVTIEISDTGGGVPVHLLEWVNGKTVYNDEVPSPGGNGPDGIGLFIVKELADIIKATIVMTSDHETFTRVYITVDGHHS